MYVTIKTIKRNLGFKGIEIEDVIIGFPLLSLVVILFTLTRFKLLSIAILIIGCFLLLPINVSKKNRMYKILILIFMYIIRKKRFVFSKNNLEKEGVIKTNEFEKRFGRKKA